MLRPGRGGASAGGAAGGYNTAGGYGGAVPPPPPNNASPYGGYSGAAGTVPGTSPTHAQQASSPSSGGYAGYHTPASYAATPAPAPGVGGATGGAYGGYGGQSGHSGYGGYGGAGGGGGYAGGYGTNAAGGYGAQPQTPVQGSFKDKQRGKKKSGGGGICSIFTKLWLWTTLAAVGSGAAAVFYRQQVESALTRGSQLIDGPVHNMEQLLIEMEGFALDAEKNIRAMKNLKDTLRLANEKKSTALQEQNRLQKRIDDLTALYESPEYEKEQQRLKSREQAWRKQVQILQEATSRESRKAVLEEFGKPPYQVEFAIHIPEAENPKLYFVVEMASLDLVPHAVQLFLKQVKNKLWDNTWFYINGPHVLQAGPQVEEDAIPEGEDERSAALLPFKKLDLDSLVFPEYSSDYPHVPWTLGFTGRPGGPDFYINKVDNTAGHGPGGQFHHDLDEYADSCFAKVIHGFEVLEQLTTVQTVESGEYQFFFEYPVNIVSAAMLTRPIRPDAEKMEQRKGGFRPWVAKERKVEQRGETQQAQPQQGGQEKPLEQDAHEKPAPGGNPEGGEKRTTGDGGNPEERKKFQKHKLENQVDP